MDLLDDAISANGIYLPSFNDVEAAVPIVLVVAETAESGTNAGVDVGIVSEKTFLARVVEVRSIWALMVSRGISPDDGLTYDLCSPDGLERLQTPSASTYRDVSRNG